jgi:hypothetical protein
MELLQNRSYFRTQKSLNNYKKIEIASCTSSDHNGIKLETNNKRNNRKYSNTWRLNNPFLNIQWVIEEIKEGIKKQLKMKTQLTRISATAIRQEI